MNGLFIMRVNVCISPSSGGDRRTGCTDVRRICQPLAVADHDDNMGQLTSASVSQEQSCAGQCKNELTSFAMPTCSKQLSGGEAPSNMAAGSAARDWLLGSDSDSSDEEVQDKMASGNLSCVRTDWLSSSGQAVVSIVSDDSDSEMDQLALEDNVGSLLAARQPDEQNSDNGDEDPVDDDAIDDCKCAIKSEDIDEVADCVAELRQFPLSETNSMPG